MFIVQPEYGFGQLICEELLSEQSNHRRWTTIECAVAWSNRAGVTRLFTSMQEFLAEGGCVRITAGLDFGRTTYEGLSQLLSLESEVDMTTHVFFDENPAITFHPKVFLFSNDEEARLLVGSNNMTGAGLSTNVEAALSFSGNLEDSVIQDARRALAAWRNEESDSRIRRLTREFLEQLRNRRYVLTEEEVRARRSSDDRQKTTTELPLFGRSSIQSQRLRRQERGHAEGVGHITGAASVEVLLMRVRRRRNGNQVQISMKIHGASFMNSVESVVAADGTVRPIGYNMARGVRNTARFEAPEMMDIENPVARFQWVNTGHFGGAQSRVLQYEIFDAEEDIEGLAIIRKLEEGIATPPATNLERLCHEQTVLSKNSANAQWYRLDLV